MPCAGVKNCLSWSLMNFNWGNKSFPLFYKINGFQEHYNLVYEEHNKLLKSAVADPRRSFAIGGSL